MLKTKKKVLANLMLLLFSLILVMILLEVSMRIAPSVFNVYPVPENYMPSIFQSDPDIGWTVRANASSLHQHIAKDFSVTVHTDERGFRKGEIFFPNRKNLLILGDSFTFGFGVEDNQTYPYYLSENLPRYNVLNAGFTSGMSLDTQYLYLKKHFKEINASLVIIQMFPGNDFFDIRSNEWLPSNAKVPEKVITSLDVGPDYNLYKRRASFVFKIGLFFQRHSYLFNFFWEKRYFFEKFFNGYDYVDAETMQRTEMLIKAVKNLSVENKIPIVFVIVPITKVKQSKIMLEGNLQDLKKMLERNNFSYLYMEDLFNYSIDQIHFKHDGHYNSFGNKLIAKDIEVYLSNLSIASNNGSLRV